MNSQLQWLEQYSISNKWQFFYYIFEFLSNIKKQNWAALQLLAYWLVDGEPQSERFKSESNPLQKNVNALRSQALNSSLFLFSNSQISNWKKISQRHKNTSSRTCALPADQRIFLWNLVKIVLCIFLTLTRKLWLLFTLSCLQGTWIGNY